MTTAQEVIRITENLIDGLARVAGCDRAEAMAKYFAEHPSAYQLYDRAHNERAKQTTASRAEPAPTRRSFIEETTFFAEVDRVMEQHNLNRPEAVVRVATENPDLYKAYDLAAKYPGRRHAEGPTREMNPGERPAAKPTKPTDSGDMTDMMRLASLVASGEMAMAKLLAAEILKGAQ